MYQKYVSLSEGSNVQTDISVETPVYDSNVEEEFAKYLARYVPTWKVQREQVFFEGNRIFIPDFVLEYRDKQVIVEIIGFWTEKYCEKKKRNLLNFAINYRI
jgi:predicted nuclease of restriction endonuclease-like RecB superfamily